MPDYQAFVQAIYKQTGIDLNLYKEVQMKRRLSSLRDKRGFKTFMDYHAALKQDEVMLHEFLDKMTINVSEFFRNKGRWDVLDKKILPMLIKPGQTFKIWSAACSSGDEPYTLAMLLSQHIDLSKVEILATDLDEKILARAKEGIYTDRALKEVPEALKKRYFTYENNVYRIDPMLKKAITFKKHNLLEDPYPKNFDLIVCRNVMIYFTEEAKHAIYQKFSHSLRDQGIFFVGSTEQIFSPERYQFKVVDTFFYQKVQTFIK